MTKAFAVCCYSREITKKKSCSGYNGDYGLF